MHIQQYQTVCEIKPLPTHVRKDKAINHTSISKFCLENSRELRRAFVAASLIGALWT